MHCTDCPPCLTLATVLTNQYKYNNRHSNELRERGRDRNRDRDRDRGTETETETDRHRQTQTDRQIDRQRQTDRKKEKEREREFYLVIDHCSSEMWKLKRFGASIRSVTGISLYQLHLHLHLLYNLSTLSYQDMDK